MLAGILALCAILLSPAGALGKLTLSATLLALWFYSYAAHSVPWFKNVYSALLVCLPLLYGSLIAGVSVPLAYYFVPGLFVLGRESQPQRYADRLDSEPSRFCLAAGDCGRSS